MNDTLDLYLQNEKLNQLIMDNQALIYSIAHYFKNYPNKEDLFQVGCIGFVKAFQRYDASLNVKFTTYAYPYILGEMKRYIRQDRGIKVSREITKLNLKIEKANIILSQQLMREPSTFELAHFLGIPEYYVVEAMRSVNVLQSLDEPIMGDGKEMSLHETVPTKVVDINEMLALKQELETLTPFEKSIIETRYMRDMTQTEAARVLGLSQVQVSRKEQKLLEKLRGRLVA